MQKTEFKVPDNFPIPRKYSVIIKQIVQGSVTTETGIILESTSAENIQRPNVGQIYAVGENVPDDLKPGMKVYYNQYANLEILINGVGYLMLSDSDVFCILNEGNRVASLIIPNEHVRKGKAIAKNDKRHKVLAHKKANDLDKRMETYKKQKK